jgi:hypothetical protein
MSAMIEPLNVMADAVTTVFAVASVVAVGDTVAVNCVYPSSYVSPASRLLRRAAVIGVPPPDPSAQVLFGVYGISLP